MFLWPAVAVHAENVLSHIWDVTEVILDICGLGEELKSEVLWRHRICPFPHSTYSYFSRYNGRVEKKNHIINNVKQFASSI